MLEHGIVFDGNENRKINQAHCVKKTSVSNKSIFYREGQILKPVIKCENRYLVGGSDLVDLS